MSASQVPSPLWGEHRPPGRARGPKHGRRTEMARTRAPPTTWGGRGGTKPMRGGGKPPPRGGWTDERTREGWGGNQKLNLHACPDPGKSQRPSSKAPPRPRHFDAQAPGLRPALANVDGQGPGHTPTTVVRSQAPGHLPRPWQKSTAGLQGTAPTTAVLTPKHRGTTRPWRTLTAMPQGTAPPWRTFTAKVQGTHRPR